MVKRLYSLAAARRFIHGAAVSLWWLSTSALAILPQTGDDLEVLEDALSFQVEETPGLRDRMTPLLVAPPLHYWQESRQDFAGAAKAVLSNVLNRASELIDCPDCDAWRLHVREGASLAIHNGPLSLAELASLRQNPRYGTARAVAQMQETPSGVVLTITSLSDGRILFHRTADSSQTLEGVKPYLHLEAEKNRRLRGESLSYVFINLGLWPNGMFQFEYVEQWGNRNQHISGVAISLFNPVLAIGGTYHYILPSMPRVNASATLYYPILNALASAVSDSSDIEDQIVLQGMVSWNFSNSYALFLGANTSGGLSIGLNLYNPLFMPFLL